MKTEQNAPRNKNGGSIPLTRYARQNGYGVSKTVSLLVLFVASFAYLLAAIPAGHGRHSPSSKAGESAVPPIPPRLFLNGETARIAATGCKVVVQSAVWDAGCPCYLYTVLPAPEDLTTVSR